MLSLRYKQCPWELDETERSIHTVYVREGGDGRGEMGRGEGGREEGRRRKGKERERERKKYKVGTGKNVSRRQAFCCALVDLVQAGEKRALSTCTRDCISNQGRPCRSVERSKADRWVSTKLRGALMPGKGLACFWEQWGAAESF